MRAGRRRDPWPGKVFHFRSDPRATELLHLVRQTSRTVDLLIVSAHRGGNWGRSVPSAHRMLAHALIDAGARVVFGHSPHIVRARHRGPLAAGRELPGDPARSTGVIGKPE